MTLALAIPAPGCYIPRMASAKPSALVPMNRRVICCGDNAPPSPASVSLRSALDQLRKLPDACVDLIYIDPPFNSNRNCENASPARTFWGETKEKRSFEDRHESTRAYVARAAWRWPACSRRPALS